jgi:FAD/FMN-containing dehydrogenase
VVTTTRGSQIQLDPERIAGLKSQLRGSLLEPADAGYDESRLVWNAMIDRHPALIVRCVGAADVIACVNFARANDILVSVRGGGHNIAGTAVCDDGMLIDLSGMRSVRVDAARRRAHVEPGATLADFDHEAQAYGLATPTGINSTTGIAGLTLGGGFGWLSRKYGLTVDNLLSADIVLADGRTVHASADSEPELFWALKGGGGNFGIVTSFEFQLHPVGPEVFAGLLVFPLEDGRSALRQYREYVRTIPDDLAVWSVMRKAPPLPFLPPEVHGKEAVVFAFMYAGEVSRGAALIEPMRSFGKSWGEHFGPMPYTAWQQAFDPLLAPGARNYWKTNNFKELSDAAIDTLVEHAGRLPSSHSEVFVALMGGQTGRVPASATAYPHRDIQYVVNVHGRWESAVEDAPGIAWARNLFNATSVYATGGAYVNFMTADESDRVQAAYGPNYQRLSELKHRYDPSNFFRLNQNVR